MAKSRPNTPGKDEPEVSDAAKAAMQAEEEERKAKEEAKKEEEEEKEANEQVSELRDGTLRVQIR